MVDLGLPNWLERKIRGYYAFRWHPEASEWGGIACSSWLPALGSIHMLQCVFLADHEARCAFYQDLPAKLATRLVQQRQEAALADLFRPTSGPSRAGRRRTYWRPPRRLSCSSLGSSCRMRQR